MFGAIKKSKYYDIDFVTPSPPHQKSLGLNLLRQIISRKNTFQHQKVLAELANLPFSALPLYVSEIAYDHLSLIFLSTPGPPCRFDTRPLPRTPRGH